MSWMARKLLPRMFLKKQQWSLLKFGMECCTGEKEFLTFVELILAGWLEWRPERNIMHKLTWNSILSTEEGVTVADFELEYSVTGKRKSILLVRKELLSTGKFCNFKLVTPDLVRKKSKSSTSKDE